MRPWIIGIDIAKATFDVALLSPEGKLTSGDFKNNSDGWQQFLRWLDRQGVEQVHACIEATGRYGDGLARFLHEHDHPVSMVNPSRIHAYGKSKLMRTKTDNTDAKLIADFCATQDPALWQPPSHFQTELQELTRHLEALKKDRQQQRNRLKAGVLSAPVRQSLQEHIDFMNRQIRELESKVNDLINENEEQQQQIALLTSIPGIGPVTAAKFLAEVPDVRTFAQARHLATYAGLTPTIHTSGTSVRKKPRLSKSGNPYLRTAFYMPALSAIRNPSPVIRHLIERLEAKGKKRMTIVGAVMRKLLHLAYGVLKTGKPFDLNYHLESQV